MKNKTPVNWICIQVGPVIAIVAMLALADARLMSATDSARLPHVQGAPISALTASGMVTSTASLTPTATLTPMITKTITPKATLTPTIQATAAITPTATRTVTPTLQSTATKTNTPVATLTKTNTPVPNSPAPTPTTWILIWSYPTPAWSTNPSAPDPWALNPYNLKTSFNWTVSSIIPSSRTTPSSSTYSVPMETVPIETRALGQAMRAPTTTNPWGFIPDLFPDSQPTHIAPTTENRSNSSAETASEYDRDIEDNESIETAAIDNWQRLRRLVAVAGFVGSGILVLGSGLLVLGALFFWWRRNI